MPMLRTGVETRGRGGKEASFTRSTFSQKSHFVNQSHKKLTFAEEDQGRTKTQNMGVGVDSEKNNNSDTKIFKKIIDH